MESINCEINHYLNAQLSYDGKYKVKFLLPLTYNDVPELSVNGTPIPFSSSITEGKMRDGSGGNGKYFYNLYIGSAEVVSFGVTKTTEISEYLFNRAILNYIDANTQRI